MTTRSPIIAFLELAFLLLIIGVVLGGAHLMSDGNEERFYHVGTFWLVCAHMGWTWSRRRGGERR